MVPYLWHLVSYIPRCRGHRRGCFYIRRRLRRVGAHCKDSARRVQLSLLKLPSRSLSYANRPAPLLPIQYYIYTREDKRPRSRPTLDSPWHKRARFGEVEQKSYLCISRKRKSAGFSSFRVLGGQLSYMSEKIILYDRKNYKQARENLLGDNFYEVLYRENFL